MAAPNADAAESLLWEEFDKSTVDAAGNRLKRKHKDTEQNSKSLRHAFRQKMDNEFTGNNWDQPGEDGVKVCARKAGKTARMIADYLDTDTCDRDLFNLAAGIIRMCQKEDVAAGNAPQGIIC